MEICKTLTGRIARYLKIEEANDIKILNFDLAVYQKDDIVFFTCTAFNKTAELIAQYCEKGTKLTLTGTINDDEHLIVNDVDIEDLLKYDDNAELYEVIERAAISKKHAISLPDHLACRMQLTLLSSTRLTVENLFWVDKERNVYQAVLETSVERHGFAFLKLVISVNLDGFSSGDLSMFRKEKRYKTNIGKI